ncbi:MAG: terminase large subunit, partial [Planctomycetota bacterium]|nr:terminase large subunit [Planctomycetota bacterium]
VSYPAERGVYVCLSSEAYTKHGLNAHLVCFDELHAQPDRELYDVLSTSMGARSQPLFMAITTADFDRPSICNEKHEYASRVRDGLVDDWAFLPAIWEAPVDADWKEPGVWAACNPNLGVSIKWEFLRREFQKAMESAAFENTFRRLYLNQRTRTDVRWLSLDDWDACEAIDEAELHGESCWAGLDLSSTRDLVALSLCFPLADDVFAFFPRFWIPEESATARSRRDKVEYLAWIRAGWIIPTKGKATDYRQIREDIDKLGQTFGIQQLAIDRLFQGEETSQNLEAMGFDVVPWGQGFMSMAGPTKRFEELLTARKTIHNGSPVMRWQVGHVTAEQDSAGNLKPSKKLSREKIDGVVSAVMSLGLALQRGQTRSVYETRGLLELDG